MAEEMDKDNCNSNTFSFVIFYGHSAKKAGKLIVEGKKMFIT